MSDYRPIRRLCIVNRGEAAMRCIRAVKSLRATEGQALEVLALYTDPDREAPFVRHADEAYRLPVRTTAVAAYLDKDLLLQVLEGLGADAVWPGWGFVAESPEFVDRLDQAGIRFLGPSGDTMRRLGDKIASKKLAEAVGVPVTAWSGDAVPDVAAARHWAEVIGLPLVIKASAGGGGRGIRVVQEITQLPALFESAASEAVSAFGDGRLFLEKMVRGGRHIEVQIVADMHGYVRAVGCRDCSVQRRHQKVIEEAPPIDLAPEALIAMQRAAEGLAREVGYSGVGTVEFLVEGERFYFLEMNPRLQVEHGITEEITRTDLVELQIRIARGERLEGLIVEQDGYCIEARVCAEDPDQGFLPAPGRIARFDPALGPHLRIDTGVVVGSRVPADFDSLIAKVMAKGSTREEARARLSTALRDCDLVIEGGATNKGYLLELLEAPDYKRGGVDTLWLDRWNARRVGSPERAPQALVLAAILAYRAGWQAARRNFFSDASNITPEKIPALDGREIDLEYQGQQYRMRVFSVGSARYRVHLDGCVVSARYGDQGDFAARMVVSGRYMRATHDVTETSIRVEVEGCVHRFGRQTAGQVRAGAPSMVVAVDVRPGQRVAAGETLGLLEAMKMEIAFTAPVAGVVSEVRVTKGQQVAAGELLLVIDASDEEGASTAQAERLQLPAEDDPLSVFFPPSGDAPLGALDLVAAQSAPHARRRIALDAVNEEIDRIALGFDVYRPRFEKIIEFLEAPIGEELDLTFRNELAEVCRSIAAFVDVDQLFSRVRHVEEGGTLGPSANARMRTYVRRIRSEGAGIAAEFLGLLRNALRHYGVNSLNYDDELERCVLRMFASQSDPTYRQRLMMAVLRHMIALCSSGIAFDRDVEVREALNRIAGMRGEISNALADTAIEAHYRVFQEPELTRRATRSTAGLERWLLATERGGQTASPPVEVLDDLALAPATLFARVLGWLRGDDRFKQVLALSTHVRRLYAPRKSEAHRSEAVEGLWIDRSRYDGKLVLAARTAASDVERAVGLLARASAGAPTLALEVVVRLADDDTGDGAIEVAERAYRDNGVESRLTLCLLDRPGGGLHFHSFVREGDRVVSPELHGLHPETAVRVDLARYRNFKLERLWSPDDIYCFYAVSRDEPEDERMFVLGDVRTKPASEGHSAELFAPIFEAAFQEASRTMRLNLGIRDPRRGLHWNRIVMHMAHPMVIDTMTALQLARRSLSNIRYLGMEKTIVRLKVISADRPDAAPREVEVVGSDLASSRLELNWRRPRRRPLVPASPYERKVAAARRRGHVYPYVIVRMLTSGDEEREREVEESSVPDARPVLPVGTFEEYDLDAAAPRPTAVSVGDRPPGQNRSAIVFGIMSTPTAKVPEGMKRVMVLSDPTIDVGALAGPECDRVIAAIDLAEGLGLPVEWIPVSSGARIAMDSGTENMDATARVVRRIVTFTQAGGVIHLIITGINIGAQSYWDALSTMLMHTRGVLIMTPEASMVLTGRNALAASGSVSAEDEVTIGGHERVMGPNGEAQYFANDLLGAFQILYRHYDFTYVVPGETGPRKHATADPSARDVRDFPYDNGEFTTVGGIFDEEVNPGRKRPFSMRSLMRGVIDGDGGFLERWGSHVGAETAIVWDAHLGGQPVLLLGIESRNVQRLGYRPLDGPEEWNGGTLFPQSSKKIARALNAASGNRPAVVLANLSGFDGSPESMRKLQLEYGAEIARAVVNFRGPIVFIVVSRYHGGAYVVFSRELNDELHSIAVEGSYASVIGGGPAATVIFPREVRARVAADPRIQRLRKTLQNNPTPQQRAEFDRLRRDVTLEKRSEVAAEFDAIHSVERAKNVGSLEEIIPASRIRSRVIELLSQSVKER